VYGPYQNIGDPYRNVVGIFMRQALQGEPITIYGDGSQTRAFSYISDIIDPMVRSLDEQVDGECFNIGGETVISINELAQQVRQLFPFFTEIVHLPERYEVRHAFCDHTKARERLGFLPIIPLRVGLGRMADWALGAGVRWSKTPEIELWLNFPPFWEKYA
jgi:UDP-glucose 4-epimerase